MRRPILLKKECLSSEDKRKYCENCGEELDPNDEYHRTFGTCNASCYMEMVGLSWGDFL
jgi:hypothetical protein